MQSVVRTALKILLLAGIAVGLQLPTIALSDEHETEKREPIGPHVETKDLFMELRANTPNQMAAFYTARGFNEASVDKISEVCFVTVHVDNKSDTILWLELDNWTFSNADGAIKRLDRDYWNSVWDKTGLSQANRATFGWTQLPEVRNLQPGEPVGANIILPRTDKPFSIKAHFRTGKYKRKGLVVVRMKNLRCAEDIKGATTQ